MANDWVSYDSAAATHSRVAVPNIFALPARDLVAKIALTTAQAILDVGAGTGVAAGIVLEYLPGTLVVALDPSLEMLRAARSHGIGNTVAGVVPGLPFPSMRFDCVLANFVLAHVRDYKAALLDMFRVLRPGGKVGITAWAELQDDYRQYWQSVAESFTTKQVLQEAMEQALPWEEWFLEAAHLRQAFEDAGLIKTELYRTHYKTQMSIADFLEMREVSIQGRFMRRTLSGRQWNEFRRTVSKRFLGRFQDPIEYRRDVHIATGMRKPWLQVGPAC